MVDSNSLSVLVVEDDPDALSNLRDILELDGIRVYTAATAAEALRFNRWDELFAIVVDRKLPDGNAEELVPRLQALAPAAAVVIVTGHADLGGAIAALRQGAADYILKPIDADLLRARLSRIAEHHRTKGALDRSEAALGALLAAAPCVILIMRADHTVQYFSPFAERLTGFSAEEVCGRTYNSLFVPDEAMELSIERELGQALSGNPSQGFETTIHCKNGALVDLVWNTQRLENYQGAPAVLAIGQDITLLKQAQDRVVQSQRLAAIGQMVTGLAHESRNALQRSQACLEMLVLELKDRPTALDLVARIQRAQDHLHHLYEEVRDYAAPIRLCQQRCNLGQIVHDTWAHLGPARQGRDVQLFVEDHVLDLSCSADPFALEQVFRNILENSIAAGADPVRIDVTFAECQAGGDRALRISFRDNGPGLNAEQRAKIFEPFYTTKTRGTGLGMAIAMRIIEAHSGTIAVRNDCRAGAEIIVTVPVGKNLNVEPA